MQTLLRLARHALSVALLPGTVTVLVPLWIVRANEVVVEWPTRVPDLALAVLGLAPLSAGLLLFAATLRLFASEGHGTLAPWDPPTRLVVSGPYRYVRNPMISGVVFVLIGEALIMRSPPHGVWAATFLALNFAYIPLFEEPQMEARFGDAYREYRKHVRRFVPRLHPWPGPGLSS